MKKKNKTRALAKRPKHKIAKRPARKTAAVIPAHDTLARAAQKKLGILLRSDKDYFRPVLTNQQILWVKFTSKKPPFDVTWSPFVPYDPILDNLHRRGLKSIHTEELPSKQCVDAGCYFGTPGDQMVRYKAWITLKNGQVFDGEGEACGHNTTSVAKSALRRVAETRAKARAGRDAVNIGVPCIVEIAPFEGEMKAGDRILSQSEVDRVVEGQVVKEDPKAAPTGQEGRPRVGTPAALPAPAAAPAPAEPAATAPKPAPQASTAATVQAEVEAKEKLPPMPHEWIKANGCLHAEAGRLDLNVEHLHAYIHRVEEVSSLRDVVADKLMNLAGQLRAVKKGAPNHKTIKQMIVPKVKS